nr:hypothetical protein [Arthrobacter sp. NicSoilB4]
MLTEAEFTAAKSRLLM